MPLFDYITVRLTVMHAIRSNSDFDFKKLTFCSIIAVEEFCGTGSVFIIVQTQWCSFIHGIHLINKN